MVCDPYYGDKHYRENITMLKKFLAKLALEKLGEMLLSPLRPNIAGLVEFEGTKDEFHEQMESMSTKVVSDANERCTIYMHNGKVVGVHHRWPNRDYCYFGSYK